MKRLSLSVALAAAMVLLPLLARADVLRYSDEVYGGITMTGNAIGLSKEFNANGPGTEDSIGTFMALNPSDVDDSPPNSGNPWFSGTTGDWQANGSSGELVLPSGAEILYAELIWAGSFDYFPEDLTAHLDTTVSVFHEGSGSTLITPAPATTLTISEVSIEGFTANYYMRSADVTTYVASRGPGTYTVGKIPATQGETQNSLNAGGWALLVVYDDPAEAFPSHVALRVGGEWIDEDNEMTFTAAGFTAAAAGTVTGHILLGALEGDADLTGDIAELSAPAGTVTLSGTNNPADNFFSSQINDISGAVDTTGTFGNRNHTAGVNASGGRQGWDITGVPISSADAQVAHGQTSLTVELSTTGDSYMPAFFALQMDSDGVERDISTGGGGGGGGGGCNTAGPVPGEPIWPEMGWLVLLGGILIVMRRRGLKI